ncbi:MAG: CopD family protein [Betaproteobacteria bacterium]|nr:CopD family protein [Betaproteobacteria bacterium]
MFFAYMALRPVAARLLEPPQRLPLWAGTFGKFFPWVWASVALILASGFYRVFQMGGAGAPAYTLLMLAIGLAMMLIFGYVYFAPYAALRRGVEAADWKAAGAALNRIRELVGINLSLGLITVAIATLGPVFG